MPRNRTDLMNIDGMLSETERETRDRVAAFVDTEIRPNIAEWFDSATLPV